MLRTFVQGLSPVLPVLIILILACLSILIAWWSYRDAGKISSPKKWALITLRAGALLILSFLLLNPYLIQEYPIDETPEIAVYLDNSASTDVERGEYEGGEEYTSRFRNFMQNRTDEFRYSVFQFGDYVREGENPDFTDGSTDIQQMVEHLLENENRFSAAILFSDGIVTRGRNPVFSAQNLSLPVITIPLGDTTTVRDVAIAGIDHNEPVFTHTATRITAEIRHRGFNGRETEIILVENGIPAERKTLQFSSVSGTEWVEFERTYTEEEFVDISIEAAPLEDEFTDQNNRSATTIRVIDDKTTILSLAYEIHPDVASIRRFIATDQQYDLIQSTYLGSDRYAGNSITDLDADDIDLLVLHGIPPGNNAELNELLESEIPVLFFHTPGSILSLNSDVRQSVSLYSPGEIRSRMDVRLREEVRNSTHPLLEYNPVQFDGFPTLTAYGANYQVSPAAEILMRANYQGSETAIPILLAGDFGNRRIVSVNAYGWSGYERSRQQEVSGFFSEFIGNLISWTSSPSDNRLLVIEPHRNTFTESEPVRIRASLINERGEPEPNASIGIDITGRENDSDRSFQMNHVNDGSYELNAGRYPSGAYTVAGTASGNGRVIDEDETRFIISNMNEELINTRRDDELLRRLASVTGGILPDDGDTDQINNFLLNLTGDNSIEQIVSETNYFYRYSYWFIIVLMLLTAEWLLRRNSSLP